MKLGREKLLAGLEDYNLLRSTAPRRLPTIDQLVDSAREKFCSPDATSGRRILQPSTLGAGNKVKRVDTYSNPSGSHFYWARIARNDPVKAAIKAESLGYAFLASDCWLLAGDADGAFESIPPREVGLPTPDRSYYRCCLALLLNRRFAPEDVLAMGESRLTSWGRSHSFEMVQAMDIWLDQQDGTAQSLEQWILDRPMLWDPWILQSRAFQISNGVKTARLNKRSWPDYAGYGDLVVMDMLPNIYKPSLMTAVGLATRLSVVIRDVENMARDIADTPRVGEGWISETELHNLIVANFAEETLIERHGSPEWLGRQHFDTWLPKWNVAIEYQGGQHDRPIEFFGGEAGFKDSVARDKRKKKLCESNGTILIEVRPGYDASEVINLIKEASSQTSS